MLISYKITVILRLLTLRLQSDRHISATCGQFSLSAVQFTQGFKGTVLTIASDHEISLKATIYIAGTVH